MYNCKSYDNVVKFNEEEYNSLLPFLKKLDLFFKKYPHINIKSFFEAPFYINNIPKVNLEFYLSSNAIKAYTTFYDTFLIEKSDSEICRQKIKDSILFLNNFCRANKINISSYISLKKNTTNYNIFLSHLKNRKIIIYTLFAYPEFDKVNAEINPDIKQTFFPLLTKTKHLRTKLYTSPETNKYINKFKKYLEIH